MPFLGSINEPLRRFFSTHARLLDGRKCYNGCSGNFTFEQLITRYAEGAEIYSNDVSLYSCALGNAALGRTLPMKVVNEELLWLQEYIDRGPAESVAALCLALELLKHEKRNSPYSCRMWNAQFAHFDDLFKPTLEKVKRALDHIRIKDYTTVDVHDYFPRPDGVNVGFLPTFVADYEKIFKRLDDSIDWPRPSYAILTAERREETVQKMVSGGDYILYSVDKRTDLPGIAQVELFGRNTVFIYSNLKIKPALIRRKVKDTVPNYRILMPEDCISSTDPVVMLEVDQTTVDHYRHMFMAKNIEPGSGGPCYLLFVGGKFLGSLIFSIYSKKGDRDTIYMLSDLAVPSVRHTRLAKLVVMASLCREVRQALEDKALKRFKRILTTARTNAPVSMKYRGVMDIHNRGEGFLNYCGDFTDTSLKEVVAIWMKKYKQQ